MRRTFDIEAWVLGVLVGASFLAGALLSKYADEPWEVWSALGVLGALMYPPLLVATADLALKRKRKRRKWLDGR